MSFITTEAWVLYKGKSSNPRPPGPGKLRLEKFSFEEIGPQEVLAEPIYGCWEANMTHSLERRPIDVVRYRGEDKIVLGNAGVVRLLKIGDQVKELREGDYCIVFCNGVWDEFGYTDKVFGYDATGTIGVLAKRSKLHQKQLIKIPTESPYSLKQWAAFSLRFITAWSNWKIAFGCWKLQTSWTDPESTYVWAWGGGVALAELMLAKNHGCQATMITSNENRMEEIESFGILPINRRTFPNLYYEKNRYQVDRDFRSDYKTSEKKFLDLVMENTGGIGASIFIDNIGTPVFRATLKALARGGVIATAGWKEGMETSSRRALECINRHIHVHTHYATLSEGREAVEYAVRTGWMPEIDDREYAWEEVPKLAQDYASGKIESYFPIFKVASH